MQTKSVLIGFLLALVLLCGGFLLWNYLKVGGSAVGNGGGVDETAITTFEECTKHFSVQESYPARCVTPGGKSFTQYIGNEEEKKDKIILQSPRPNQTVLSPLTITGMARGTWYFEASFPVVLIDANGKTLFEGPAQAQGEWMTENFVPFKITITFTKPTTPTGKLILKKDNPSGDPERDESLEIPVSF